MIQCEGQSNTGMCVAIANSVGDVLDSSHYCSVYFRSLSHYKKVRIQF